MRKRPILLVSLVMAAATAIAASVAFAGPPVTGADSNTQSIDVKVGPKSLSKTTFTPGTLEVTTKLTSPNPVPVPATGLVVDFDKNAQLYTKGLATCNSSQLQNKSTELAEEACGKAIIGKGTAHALLPVGGTVYDVEQTVTAFNGIPKGGKPTVLLHAYGTKPLQTTLVLTGVVSNYNKQGYGPRLDVEIPLLAAGTGALTDFKVKIDKKWKYKGVQRSFVSAKCPNSKKLKARGVFEFKDGESIPTVSTQTCSQKG